MERTTRWRLTCRMVGALIILAPGTLMAQKLRDGVIVDHDTAYISAPNQSVSAIDLLNGSVRWNSSNGALPLALNGNRLLTQVEPTPATQSRLELAVLNTAQSGARLQQASRALPAGVRAIIGETLRGKFRVAADREDGTALVAWDFQPRVPQGIAPRPDATDPQARAAAPATPAPGQTMRGTLRVNMTSGAIAPVTAAAPPAPLLRKLTATERSGVASTLAARDPYVSADGAHLAVSERIADDRTWNKYRWSIYDRGSGQSLGAIATHVSIAPFVVRNSRVIFTTTPYVHRELGEQPAKLRAYDLTSGSEAWSVEVRDLEYRGPVPP